MQAVTDDAIDEASSRYAGWRIVGVCFLVATFGWGLGFYGQSVYVAELQRIHGWPASLIASATTFFYLFGALLVAFLAEAIKAFGPRVCLIAGTICMAVAAVLLGQVEAPWQLYAVYALFACGWAGTSLGAVTNTLGLWFDRKRGMAISLALNGASFGGVVGVPLLVVAIGAVGFAKAMLIAAIAMAVLLIPVIAIFVGTPPRRPTATPTTARPAELSAAQIRGHALRDPAFLSMTIAFSVVLFAQVGFIVHLVAFLDPQIGRDHAAVAISLLTAMAVAGRVLFSTVIDRLNQRVASALSFLSQALALTTLIFIRDEWVLIAACAVFGFSVGNLITLPALIVQREMPASWFGVLISLVTAITQVAYSFGPGVVGLLHDLSGGYTKPFAMCIALEIIAAMLILTGRRARSG